jgi:quercetin dioxygenase-like cupin family protein
MKYRFTSKWIIGLLGALAVAVYGVITWASTPVGVTPTLIGRGTFHEFEVKSHNSAFKFEAEAEPEVDFVVRTNDYAPGSSTGWHTHPGPVFITVTQGEVTFYEVDDPRCSPKVVREGEGYVDTGHGHIGRNETSNPAKDVVVAIAPVGRPFRSELPAPGPYCSF